MLAGRLQRAALVDPGADARKVVAEVGRSVDYEVTTHAGTTLTSAALLCMPVALMREEHYRALVRMHTHALEEEIEEWGGVGSPCVICERAAYAGHHRVCTMRTPDATVRAHHNVRNALCAYLRAIPRWWAATEKEVGMMANGTYARGDIRVVDADGRVFFVEIKTYDPRCKTWRGKSADRAAADLRKKGKSQYPPGTDLEVLTLGADGALGKAASAVIAQWQRARDEEGTRNGCEDGPSLRAELAVALARAEAHTYAFWAREVRASEPYRHAAAAARAAAAAGDAGAGGAEGGDNDANNGGLTSYSPADAAPMPVAIAPPQPVTRATVGDGVNCRRGRGGGRDRGSRQPRGGAPVGRSYGARSLVGPAPGGVGQPFAWSERARDRGSLPRPPPPAVGTHPAC